jgi:hypothetical protein
MNITDNCIVSLKEDLTQRRQVCLSTLVLKDRHLLNLAKNEREDFFFYSNNNSLDVFHVNHAEKIGRDINIGGGVTFKKGDILFSSRHLGLIGVIDVEKEVIYWHWGDGMLQYPHHSTMQPNGNIVLFDNGAFRGYSTIVEYNPAAKRVEWSYNPRNSSIFFSHDRGGAQRLPNNNTLITDSGHGRVFEINPSGRIVWEYINPPRGNEQTGNVSRSSIFRMTRIESGSIRGGLMAPSPVPGSYQSETAPYL